MIIEDLPFAADINGCIHRAFTPEGGVAYITVPFTEEQQQIAEQMRLSESQILEESNASSNNHDPQRQVRREPRHHQLRSWLAALRQERHQGVSAQ